MVKTAPKKLEQINDSVTDRYKIRVTRSLYFYTFSTKLTGKKLRKQFYL